MIKGEVFQLIFVYAIGYINIVPRFHTLVERWWRWTARVCTYYLRASCGNNTVEMMLSNNTQSGNDSELFGSIKYV